MISYGFSIQGKSHQDRNTVCQDSNKIIKLRGNWMLGMVADGVGSALRSDVGSKLAVELLGSFCKKNFSDQMTDQKLESLLLQGYKYAMKGIAQYAEKEKQPLEYFDTTLSVALYNGEKVIYGHAGDGGILVRLNNGKTIPLTERQKGTDGSSVVPLRAGEAFWVFGTYDGKVASVLLVTDGLLDGVFQPVLVNLPPDLTTLAKGNFSKKNVYVTASEFFMNPDCVYQNRRIKDANKFLEKYVEGNLEREAQVYFWECIKNGYVHLLGKEHTAELEKGITKFYYAVWALKNVTDDKTIVCLMNERAKVEPQKIEYYREPNWKWRQDCYNALLYGKPMPPAPINDSIERNIEEQKIEDENKKEIQEEKMKEIKDQKKPHFRVLRTNYGYIISSIIAVLLVAGVGFGAQKFFLSGEKDDEIITQIETGAPYVTKEPTDTPYITDEPIMNVEELDDSEKSFLNDNSKKFIKALVRVDISEYEKEEIVSLGKLLKCHGMDKELNNILEEVKVQVTPVSGSSAQISEFVSEGKHEKLNKYFILVNTEEEKKIFVNGFRNIFSNLSQDKKKQVIANLERILSYEETLE